MPVVECPTCGELNPDGARLCGMCRTTLVEDTEQDGGRLVTVVTSDLKGSTALGERLDPESLREVLNRYFDVMRARLRVARRDHREDHRRRDRRGLRAARPPRRRPPPGGQAAAETKRALATLNDELEQVWGVRLVNADGRGDRRGQLRAATQRRPARPHRARRSKVSTGHGAERAAARGPHRRVRRTRGRRFRRGSRRWAGQRRRASDQPDRGVPARLGRASRRSAR